MKKACDWPRSLLLNRVGWTGCTGPGAVSVTVEAKIMISILQLCDGESQEMEQTGSQ